MRTLGIVLIVFLTTFIVIVAFYLGRIVGQKEMTNYNMSTYCKTWCECSDNIAGTCEYTDLYTHDKIQNSCSGWRTNN